MEARIEGRPSFCHIHVSLAPGETIIAESDAMASMAADLDVKAKLNGGLLSGLGKKFLGGESLFINELGYLLDSGDPYILWSTEAAFSVPPMMDLYGTGSMATACCTSR